MERPPIRYTKTIDGLHIAYHVVGSGPLDLVWAPGWFSNLECAWEVPELSDFLAELASLSRLILFDRRGFGLSDSPTTTGSWSLELGMDDIRAVMDAAGSERAVLFGMDDGGALCTLFAASYPDRVSALVLFAVWVKYFRSPDYPWDGRSSRTRPGCSASRATGELRSSGRIALMSRHTSALIPDVFGLGLATRASRRLAVQPWPSPQCRWRRTFGRCCRP